MWVELFLAGVDSELVLIDHVSDKYINGSAMFMHAVPV